MPDFNVCRNRPFLLGIDRNTFEKLAGIASYREYQPGDIIIREGEQKDEIILIEKGQVAVFKAGGKRDRKAQKITSRRCSASKSSSLSRCSRFAAKTAEASVPCADRIAIRRRVGARTRSKERSRRNCARRNRGRGSNEGNVLGLHQ